MLIEKEQNTNDEDKINLSKYKKTLFIDRAFDNSYIINKCIEKIIKLTKDKSIENYGDIFYLLLCMKADADMMRVRPVGFFSYHISQLQ